jgi:hypothetical protein
LILKINSLIPESVILGILKPIHAKSQKKYQK